MSDTPDDFYSEVAELIRPLGAPDIPIYRWIEVASDTAFVQDGDVAVDLDRSVIWRGHPMRVGWSEQAGVIVFAFGV